MLPMKCLCDSRFTGCVWPFKEATVSVDEIMVPYFVLSSSEAFVSSLSLYLSLSLYHSLDTALALSRSSRFLIGHLYMFQWYR